MLASLNHPNIGAIYGFVESEGRQALVLELVDGQTIAERVRQGPVPIDEALGIARQIAEALEAAREQGVIHRDLKPDNIKLRPNGTVKVLDFGLAKLVKGPDSDELTSEASRAQTITSPAMTRLGVILGTAAYMSPEQARGMAVDKQTDVWAFGCVLYELLSGRPAFTGATVSDTIAKIIEREPDWQSLPASTPPRVRALLRQCLRKEQKQRLHDIADVRIEIEEARVGLAGRRRAGALRLLIAVVALAAGVTMGALWLGRTSTPAGPREPVTVLIADLQNRTGDSAFDATLEPMLKLALEGASFISAFDRNGIARSLGVRPPATLDERVALEMAVKQGLGVVLSGSVDLQGSAYALTLKAAEAVTGRLITTASNTAASKDQVLGAATALVTAIRTALGDDVSEAGQRFATQTFSATSLEVVRAYAAAAEALSRSQSEQALQNFAKAVALDPNFGLGYAGMASAARNLDRQQDAERYAREAVRHLDGMTERERYRTRGLFYMVTGDYQACVKEYGELIERSSADAPARNNRALCLTHTRDLPSALAEMRHVIKILPKRALYRDNLALYEAYSGDFRAAEQEARGMKSRTSSACSRSPLPNCCRDSCR